MRPELRRLRDLERRLRESESLRERTPPEFRSVQEFVKWLDDQYEEDRERRRRKGIELHKSLADAVKNRDYYGR